MADNTPLSPDAEFNAPPVEPAAAPAPAPAAPPVDAAARAEVAALKAELQSLKTQGQSDSQIVAKLRDVFTDKAVDPRDAYVRKEITRLLPELQDVERIKQLMPAVLETLGAAHEEKIAERANSAVEFMKSHMKSAGLNVEDDEAVGYMEEVLTREIKTNPELRQMWAAGKIKAAVGKAFDKANGKLFAPVRANTKRSAVDTITGAPKASPRGAAPSPSVSSPRQVDTADTSREGRKAIHDAAFDRLQELLDR